MNTSADFALLSSLESLEIDYKAKRDELIAQLSPAGRDYYNFALVRQRSSLPKIIANRKPRANSEELNSSLLAIQDAIRTHYEKNGEGATKREIAAMIPDLEFSTIDSYVSVQTNKLWKIVGTKQISGQRGPASNVYMLIEPKTKASE